MTRERPAPNPYCKLLRSSAVWFKSSLTTCALVSIALFSTVTDADGIDIPDKRAPVLKTTVERSSLATPVLGDWIVSDLLLTRGLSNAQLSNHYSSSLLLAYRYTLQPDGVTVINERTNCTLDTRFASRATPLRALFDGESSARPPVVKRRLLAKINQYALPETIRAQSARGAATVAIYAYRCKGEQTAINDRGDRFAVMGDRLLVTYSQAALLILRRAPSTASADQVAFCDAAAQGADRVICADAQRYALHRYIEETATCAVAKSSPDRRDLIRKLHDTKLKKRNDCGDNASCVRGALFEHAQWIAQSIPALNHCRAGVLQAFAR